MLDTAFKHKIVPRDYDIFAGLDVDKRSYDVTFVDHEDRLRSMKIPSNANHLLNYVRRHFPGKRIAFAYETGPTGYGLYDKLTAAGHPCLVLASSMIPTARGQRVKTNRLDSRKISVCLRGGELKSIHVPSILYRDLRHLIHVRDTFVRQAVACKLRIKALLLLEEIPFPSAPANSQWSNRVLFELQQRASRPAIRFTLDRLLEALTQAQRQVYTVTKEIRGFCQSDSELSHCTEFLRSIPGIGEIVATHLLARIGDWRLIRNSRQISGLLGVVPSEDSTGDDVNRGSITKIGDERLRNKLNQAAWAAIRKDPQLAQFYSHIYKKHPKTIAARKAITAVVNKLCRRIACVLKEQRPYVVGRKTTSVSSKNEETATLQGTTRRFAETRQPCLGSSFETETPGRPRAPRERRI